MLKSIRWIVLALATALCSFIPWATILGKVYAWPLKIPEFYEGLGECVALLALLGLISLLVKNSTLRLIATGLCAAVYLTSHQVIAPFVANLLLMDAYLGIGMFILNRSNFNAKHSMPVALSCHAIAGLAVGGCFNILVCTFIPITPLITILLGVVLFTGALALNSFKSPIYNLLQKTREFSRAEHFISSGLVLLILIQSAKSGRCLDYDSTWYGARPLHVLFSDSGFWHNQGLAHFVYYYPKLFEVLALPVSGTIYPAYIMGVNVALFGLSTLPLYALLRKLCQTRLQTLLWVCCLCCVPAFANMASTTKTDITSFFCGFASMLFILEYSANGRRPYLYLALSSIALLLSSKITAYAFAASLGLGLGIAHVLKPRTNESNQTTETRSHLMILGTALILWGCFLLRTYLITGIPTFPLGTEQWGWLGLHPNYPWTSYYSALVSSQPSSLWAYLHYLGELLFSPGSYTHFVMSWPSNIAFLLLLFCILTPTAAKSSVGKRGWHFLCLLPTCLMGLALVAFLAKHHDGGTDGNYYTLPIFCTIVCCLWLLQGDGKQRIPSWVPVCLFISLTPIMFISHWSWHPGTSSFQSRQLSLRPRVAFPDNIKFKDIGASKIEEYLSSQGRFLRSVGISRGKPNTADEAILRALSGQYEDLEQLGGTFPPIFQTAENFEQFLKRSGIAVYIVPKNIYDDEHHHSIAIDYARNLQKQGATVINDEEFLAFVLRQ